MGDAKRRNSGLGVCIYCRATDDLSDEHVMPFGLGGQLVLHRASCKTCAIETGRLEQRLLRGHWWPYRKKLGLQTRRPSAQNVDFAVKIITIDQTEIDGRMPIDSFVAAIVVSFDPPSILSGVTREDLPFASRMGMKLLGPMPTEALVSGNRYVLANTDRVEFPVNFHAGDLSRFLAKVAHGYAISRLGLDHFSIFFLPSFILGQEVGILTYVGGYATPLNLPVLPGGGHNRMMIVQRDNFVSVCIQLFIDNGDPPPIFEVVVGQVSN